MYSKFGLHASLKHILPIFTISVMNLFWKATNSKDFLSTMTECTYQNLISSCLHYSSAPFVIKLQTVSYYNNN